MRGITLGEEAHLVNILPPIDINGGKNSDVFSLKNHAHASIIIQQGVNAGASTVTVTECDDFTPTNETAIAFDVYKEETAQGDTLGVRTAVAAAGFAMTTNDDTHYVIELDAAKLSAGYDKVRVKFSNPAASALVSAVAVLSGARYANEQSDTAIV